MTLNHEELRRLADAAHADADFAGGVIAALACSKPLQAFVKAAGPSTVRALLDELKTARGLLQRFLDDERADLPSFGSGYGLSNFAQEVEAFLNKPQERADG